jgi:uncharacterized protein YkwD
LPAAGRWLLIVLLAALPSSAAGAVKDKTYIADEIVTLLDGHRREAGVGPLERRAALDQTAALRAREMAAQAPEMKMAEEQSLDALLQQAGVLRYQRAQEHVEMQQGYADAAQVAVARWQGAAGTWSIMMDPRVHGLGLATVVGDDGWLVLVAVFVEDLEVPDDLTAWEARLLSTVNRIRVDHGLPPQEMSPSLSRLARRHSQDMAQRDYFAHISPEGADLSARIQGSNLAFLRLAENIGRNRGQEDPVQKAVDGWMNSANHRKNLLDRELTQCGVGIAVDDVGMFYFTQVFLQPIRRR